MKILEKILKIIATILFIVVVLLTAPFIVSKVMGYEMYEVDSKSMAPKIPDKSVVFVKETDAYEIYDDDIITFYEDESHDNIATYRVVEVNEQGQTFMTCADANNDNDENIVVVPYDNLIGKVDFSVPYGTLILKFMNGMVGKIAAAAVAVIIIGCFVASAIIRKRYAELFGDNCKKSGFISNIILLVGIAIIIFSGYNLIRIFSDYKTSNDVYSKLEEKYVKAPETVSKETPWYEMTAVDFKSLKEQNEDVAGWIYFENEDINYPIMYSGDDNYYLRRTFERENATAGSIFLEGENNPDFNDPHTIIYGHNMRNLSMFGKLKYYNRDESYYETHQYFQIITDGMSYRYRIFAYATVDDDSSVYQVGFNADDDFGNFVQKMVDNSQRDTGIVPTKDDKVITLSTCSPSGATYRFVVHAVRVDEHAVSES